MTFYNALAFIESPMQIGVVLLIALLVFGPNKLPEIGRQIGSALRELRKATNDVVKSFNTDHEPDPEPYNYGYGDSTSPNYYDSSQSSVASVDYTDYTIAGMPVIAPPPEPYTRPGILDDYSALGGAASSDPGIVGASEVEAASVPAAPVLSGPDGVTVPRGDANGSAPNTVPDPSSPVTSQP